MGKDFRDRTTLLASFGYDGARFCGLQPQGALPTAGGALQQRIVDASGARPRGLAFAARTDRGVHARLNLATFHFRARDAIADVNAVIAAVEAARDDGLRDVVVRLIPHTVHARGASRGKHYRYRVHDGVDDEDVLRNGASDRWCIAPRIDVERARAAAAHLVGTHDFSSLRAGGCTAKETTKTLVAVDVARGEDGVVVIDVIGTAFLRKMVRNLVGLLVECAVGWRDVDELPRVLQARHRTAAGLCAPPEGLCLWQVGFAWPDDGSALVPALRHLGIGALGTSDLSHALETDDV